MMPGCMPYMVREPIRMAVTASPGMPRVIMVVIAPPITALLAEEATARPSREPLPYSSGCLLIFLALPQEMMEAMSPPAAGMAPMTVPSTAAIRVGTASSLACLAVGSTRPRDRLTLRASSSASCSALRKL